MPDLTTLAWSTIYSAGSSNIRPGVAFTLADPVTLAVLLSGVTDTNGQIAGSLSAGSYLLTVAGVTKTVDVPGAGGVIADASATAKGAVKLAGDLGGTAALPTVPGKASQAALDVVESRAANPQDAGFDLVLLIGQSNEVGRATPDLARYETTDPRIYQFASMGAYANIITQAVEPLAHHESLNSGIGAGSHFLRWYAGAIPSNRKVLAVPCAHGATGFFTDGTTFSWEVTDLSVTSLVQFARTQTLAALAAAGPNARVAAIHWHQGEADMLALSRANAYAAQLDALIDYFRGQFGASIPFILGQTRPEYFAAQVGGPTVNAVHVDTPRRKILTGFAYAQSSTATADGNPAHFDAPTIRALGKATYYAFARALTNLTGAAPGAPSTVTLTQSGTSIAVAWDQVNGHPTDYSVEYKLTADSSWTALARTGVLDVRSTITGRTLGSSYDVRVRAEGSTASAWTQATIVLVNAPSQVTGVTAGTPTSTTLPLTWTATPTASSYLVEYKRAADATWLTAGTVTATSATVSGLSPEVSYNVRVSALNATGAGPVSSTATASTAAQARLLTEVPVAAARAYSLRNLKSDYVGAAIRVRRASDSTEQDIGFASGVLDRAALLTFAGAGDAFVKTLYDQSGNARNLTQATASLQPRIVLAGALDAVGGFASMVSDGVDDIMEDASPGYYAAGAGSVLTVLRHNGAATMTAFAEASSANSVTFIKGLTVSATGGTGSVYRNDANTIFLSSFDTTVKALNTTLHQLSVIDSGATMTRAIDGTTVQNASAYTRAGVVTLNTFSLFARSSLTKAEWAPLHMTEFVMFYSALSSANRTAGESNQKAFYGTP